MRFSKKSDYALRALMQLADCQGEGPKSIRSIADANHIPYRFLQQIMLDLKANGWIKTVAGREGGVMLCKQPEAISMGEVVRFFDGVLAPVGCVSTTHYKACSEEPTCRFRRVLLEIRNYTASLMDRTTLDMLTHGTPPSREEIFSQVYTDGAGI